MMQIKFKYKLLQISVLTLLHGDALIATAIIFLFWKTLYYLQNIPYMKQLNRGLVYRPDNPFYVSQNYLQAIYLYKKNIYSPPTIK